MARPREELGQLLREVANSTNVYYQPPSGIEMKYPAIRYSLADIDNIHADNQVYLQSRTYELIVIDEDPDSELSDAISKLPKCSFQRSYPADDLNHFVYRIEF